MWGQKCQADNYYRNQVRWWRVDLFDVFFFRNKTVYNLVIDNRLIQISV